MPVGGSPAHQSPPNKPDLKIVLLAELLHATAGVDDALNAGGERVALGADVDFQVLLVEPVSKLSPHAQVTLVM